LYLRYIYTLSERDIYVAPFYALLLSLFIFIIWKFFFQKKVKLSYLLFALVFKLLSALSFCLVYQFYYLHGDSFRYYRNGSRLYNIFYNEDFSYFTSYLSANELKQNFHLQDFLYKYELIISSSESFFISKISGFIGIFTLDSYVATTLVMSFFCFTGLMAFLYVLYDKYKSITGFMFLSVMFVPSVCFWSSSLMKDTILVGSLGWMFFSMYYIFKGKFWYGFIFLLFFVNAYFCQKLKPFINYIFFPCIGIYALIWYHSKFKNGMQSLYKFAGILFFLFGLTLLHYLVGLQTVYTVVFNKFLDIAVDYQSYHTDLANAGQIGSAYNLGTIDFTFIGILKKIPASLVVSLFRPFLWECHNVVMLISAIESIFVLFFTIYVFFKVGLKLIVKNYFKDPIYAFLVSFSFGFLFVTGFITFNFGTLVRYKIPGLITYLLALSILLLIHKNEGKPLFRLSTSIKD